jgi:hypothetical protein
MPELTPESKLKIATVALEGIANLWPYPPNCADVMSVNGINDGRSRAILLEAALEISRNALAKMQGRN